MKSSNKTRLLCSSWAITETGMFWILLFFSIVIFLVNILVSLRTNGFGFPLDDAWIHQTYARSLATHGTWRYSVNESSAGSTSPLWTLLLVPGFLFGHGNPFIWTFILSWAGYFGVVFISIKMSDYLLPGKKIEKLILGMIMVLEWHLVWASGSGMETILFTLVALLLFYLLLDKKHSFLIGFLVGLLVCIRPDGITLLGPVLVVSCAKILKRNIPVKQLFWVLIGVALPLAGYGYHNYSLSGQLLPNTFFAKSAEYHELLSNPLTMRFFNLSTILISGVGILLLPGFIRSIYSAVKGKDIWRISSILWVLGFLLMYAIRLPVTYQHGRYLIPVVPMYLFLGFCGTTEIIALINEHKQFSYKIIVYGSLLITSLVFLTGGVKSYSADVKVINNLMVEPALWLRDHSEKDSIIAAHDIGAIGFFSERKIIDLAGLIDPEVVPIIRDEVRLSDFIHRSGADYLVVFTDWYEKLGKLGSREIEYSVKIGNLVKTVEIRSLP